MKTQCNYSHNEQGFSLLEVLIAFSILTMSMTVIAQAFSTSLRNASINSQYLQSLTLAESKLAQIKYGGELSVGVTEGLFDKGQHWRATVNDAMWEGDDLPIKAYTINVEVYWKHASKQQNLEISAVHLDSYL